jgi:hypothetical protein
MQNGKRERGMRECSVVKKKRLSFFLKQFLFVCIARPLLRVFSVLERKEVEGITVRKKGRTRRK